MKSLLGNALTAVFALLAVTCSLAVSSAAENFLKVGDTAPEFSLMTADKEQVELKTLLAKGPVVLVVLRGNPGYQCPACTAQVGQFLGKAKEFEAAGAQVVFVYPGPKNKLTVRAREFVGEQKLPGHAKLVLDPDYKFTKAWRLRWDAPQETAYPATFVIQPDGKLTFAQISQTHGGRANVADVLKSLTAK